MVKGGRSLNSERRKMISHSSRICKQRRSVRLANAYQLAQEAYALLVDNEGPLLHAAAREGRKGLVKSLLASGTDPNQRGAIDCTPLHEAAARGNTEIIRFLLRHGADVMAKTLTGQTPLHWAADAGHYGAVMVLLSAGSEVGSTSMFGYTAQDFANSNGHDRISNLLEIYRRWTQLG